MVTKPVSVMLVGLGGYGGYYVNYLLDQDPGRIPFEFCAGVDPRPESCVRHQELEKRSIPIYADIDIALASHNPELIIIATPIHTHLSLTQVALSCGASVLLEKPLCGDLREADQLMIDSVNAPGFVAIGYQSRYTTGTAKLLEDVESGRFGKLLRQKTLALRPRNAAYFQRSPWAGALMTPDGRPVFDGPAMNASAHMLYFQLLISDTYCPATPQIKECYLSRVNAIENHDTVACSFYCGSVEHLFLTSHAVSGDEQIQLSYQFEHAEVSLDEDGVLRAHDANAATIEYGPMSGAYEKIEACLYGLRGGPKPVGDILSARRHVEVIEQLQQFPIIDVSSTFVQDDEGTLYVPGLCEVFTTAYQSFVMPEPCHDHSQASGVSD